MWQNIEHEVWSILKNLRLTRKKILLCCSGGADSVALFWVLIRLKVPFEVLHFHHGPTSKNISQFEFRNRARDFVKDMCHSQKVVVHIYQSEEILNSEAAMRDFRRSHILPWSKKAPVFMAHHSQDLLETRMMRLIRGVGSLGLASMRVSNAGVYRPFLSTSPESLRAYLKSINKSWCEDPSNQNNRYFRNWLRNQWLPRLEKRYPGSLRRMSESLENLSAVSQSSRIAMCVEKGAIKHSEYWSFSNQEQMQILALLLKSKGQTHFTKAHLSEIQKQILDNKKKHHTFRVGGIQWVINAEQITLQE